MAIIKLTKDKFNQEVVNSQDPVLVDFWAPWCGPCKMMSPVLDAVAADEPDARIGKVNIDEQPQLAAQFGIMSIPTLALFQDGKIVSTSVGLQSKKMCIRDSIDRERVSFAQSLGIAAEVIDSGRTDLEKLVMDKTDGRGAAVSYTHLI